MNLCGFLLEENIVSGELIDFNHMKKILLKLLCWFGFHKEVTREEEISEHTTHYYVTCCRCKLALRESGCTSISLVIRGIPKDN